MENKTELSQQELLLEIWKNTRATKRYMQWQFIITVALIVIPILGMAFILPSLFKSISSIYGPGGYIQNIQGIQGTQTPQK